MNAPMTPQHLHHLIHLTGTFNELVFEQYRHQDCLVDVPIHELLLRARDQAINAYLLTQTALERLEDES